MSEPDRQELQRLAQLVEVNRERLQALDQQIRNLEGIRIEQEHAIESLQAISEEGAKGVMVPLGAGVQLVADIPPNAGAVVDVGSRVQAEKTRMEATDILRKRNEELRLIMESIKKDYDELENHVVELANRFNEAVGVLQNEEEKEEQPLAAMQVKQKRKPRRKRGTELTLDD
ncbi:MAG: prefoldin subunit alpha [Candidatus Thermoplasmatota archaeon]|nr:prefoldin subunit alpha [Euryarchaeota archaeon]MEC7694549.1 prefoldin subunit alpha [Candidatus Thermoplasmatota archaeon]|tara:strand:- start:6119 stop:6637 length:519 start_codon:yes stop_codon:yes gene_type:complete